MAATGFFYTFTRPRQALPMSMLKYDPIGKDAPPLSTTPPTPHPTRIGGQRADGDRSSKTGIKRMGEFVQKRHAAEHFSEGQSYLASS
jgi:hypothetical protein